MAQVAASGTEELLAKSVAALALFFYAASRSLITADSKKSTPACSAASFAR
jgi:hypothetical protein